MFENFYYLVRFAENAHYFIIISQVPIDPNDVSRSKNTRERVTQGHKCTLPSSVLRTSLLSICPQVRQMSAWISTFSFRGCFVSTRNYEPVDSSNVYARNCGAANTSCHSTHRRIHAPLIARLLVSATNFRSNGFPL